jgi:hypothetical protein
VWHQVSGREVTDRRESSAPVCRDSSMDDEMVWKAEMAVEREESRTSCRCLSRSHLRASGVVTSKGVAMSERIKTYKSPGPGTHDEGRNE